MTDYIYILSGVIGLLLVMYLIGLRMSKNNPDKSIGSVLKRGRIGAFIISTVLFVVIVGGKIIFDFFKPSAELKILEVRRFEIDNIDALEIQVDGKLNRIKPGEFLLVVWFYLETEGNQNNFPFLKDFNKTFSDSEGNVSAGSKIVIDKKFIEKIQSIAELEGSRILIPIQELHLRENIEQVSKTKKIQTERISISISAQLFSNRVAIGASPYKSFVVE